MTSNDFNKIVKEAVAAIKNTLCVKAGEYAINADRLEAFKRGGQILGTDSANALLGMLNKHIMSIYMMVQNKGKFSIDRWAEKVIDSINYLILLFAIKVEENQNA